MAFLAPRPPPFCPPSLRGSGSSRHVGPGLPFQTLLSPDPSCPVDIMNTLTSGLCSSQASPWMPPFSPHPCLTNSYHPSRPSSRPTSLLRAEWVSPVSVLSQPLGQCDGAPKSACDQSACVHRPLSWDSEPGGQGAFPCFICLLATSLGLPCAPFLSPYSSLFPQSFLPIWLSHWFPLLLPHCWSLHQSGRPVLCWIHEDPSGCGALEAAGVEPPAPRCVPGCWPCCLLSGLRESHCQAMTDPLGPVSKCSLPSTPLWEWIHWQGRPQGTCGAV